MSGKTKNISGLTSFGRRHERRDVPVSIPPSGEKASDAVRAVFRGDDRYTFIRALYAPGGSYGTRRQRTYQLVLMLEGSAHILAQGEDIMLKEGEGILMRAGWRIFYRFDADRASVHTSCEVEPRSLKASERALLHQARGVHTPPAALHARIADGLASPSHIPAPFHEAQLHLAKSCLLHFAAHVLAAAAGKSAPPHPALLRSHRIIEESAFELRTAKELARRCGVSVSRLRQLHRQQGLESPSAMIWRSKSELAIHMIRSTGLGLDEIASQCGFANPFHLSRCVKKHTGLPPRELRRVEWAR